MSISIFMVYSFEFLQDIDNILMFLIAFDIRILYNKVMYLFCMVKMVELFQCVSNITNTFAIYIFFTITRNENVYLYLQK